MRRYPRHDKRAVVELNGFWDFAFLGQIEPDEVDIAKIRYGDRMAVPGCFDSTPQYARKRGLTAYRTRVFLRDATPHRLFFGGVNHWCRVFASGKPLRDHVGGHAPFQADITGHKPGETDIVVLVDNRFNYERNPLHRDTMDWYHHGGIARPVELHRLGDLWIDSVKIVTADYRKRRVSLSLSFGATQPQTSARLSLSFDGKELMCETIDLTEEAEDGEPGGLRSSTRVFGEMETELAFPRAALWSPESPNLHDLHVQLGGDDLRQRFGIRQVKTEGTRILINGEPIRLLGVCRHEMHPDFGCGLPDAQIGADLQIIRKMGCNFVRGTHYPQDPRFLDLCDEMGICVWNESIGWHDSEEDLNNPHFIQAQLDQIEEMVASSINHPSVIIWGLLNEAESNKEGSRQGYTTLINRLRELDPSRPVSYALYLPEEDKLLDLVDIVGLNYYPAWYRGEMADVTAMFDNAMAKLDASGGAGKPMLISEMGCDSVPGHRDWYQDRWSEDYHAKLLDLEIGHLFRDRSRACGLAVWQFTDCRSSEVVASILKRPKGYNCKGLLDEYRRPKLAYDVVERWFHQLAEKENKGRE